MACVALPVVAQTTVISDTFTRSGALAGTAPDVRPGSETWQDSVGLSTNGSSAYPIGSGIYTPTGWLSLSITTGITYSVSVAVNMAAQGTYTGNETTCWVALGLGKFSNPNRDVLNAGGPLFLLRNNGGADLYKTSGSVILTKNPGFFPTSSTLRLDYTRVADGSAVVSYFVNDGLVTTNNYVTAPTVEGIGIQSYYQPITTTFDNLTVTAIPEPSTYAALAGMAALGFAAWRRRKTAAKA